MTSCTVPNTANIEVHREKAARRIGNESSNAKRCMLLTVLRDLCRSSSRMCDPRRPMKALGMMGRTRGRTRIRSG